MVHLGNLEEGLNRRGARDLDDSDATATRRRLDGSMRWKHGQSSRQRKHRPASTALWRYKATRRRLIGDLQEGLNRRGARNLTHMYTRMHMHIYIGEAIGET